MKLKDLVANSLPRVRTRKKKATPTVAPAVSSAADLETRSGNLNLDKSSSRRTTATHNSFRHNGLELQAISESSWKGNALYQGLETTRAVKFHSQTMSTSYTSANHGMVTSHSAEGFSSQLRMMSRSYDSRISVPDCNDSDLMVSQCLDSCPQVSSISETRLDPFMYPKQHYHCHYHTHDHHHYYHHHLHAKPLNLNTSEPPIQHQQIYADPSSGKTTRCSKSQGQDEVKAEAGFFRKSLASLGGIRKSSRSRSKKDLKPDENGLSSVCLYPETGASSDKKSSDKRPAKPKRKSLKTFSKWKENKDSAILNDQTWFSDNDCRSAGRLIAGQESLSHVGFASFNKSSRSVERSVESCTSCFSGAKEGLFAPDVDLGGYDSASLSGYESDLPRSKFHRSRSRIKTNPWLPSPHPPVVESRAQQNNFHESREDLSMMEDSLVRLPRSASFEQHRKLIIPLHNLSHNTIVPADRCCLQRPRSLTPSDTKVTLNRVKHVSGDTSPPWWSPSQEPHRVQDGESLQLNDLSTNIHKSTISPNSEFILLADNLEQLANNISFEYEEMLDTTLESVSISQEDGQASIQELLTDEENGSVTKGFLTCDGDVHTAHSPDSGIGGLGSTDGDDVLTPNAQRDHCAAMSVESYAPSSVTSTALHRSEVSQEPPLTLHPTNSNLLSIKCLPATAAISINGAHMSSCSSTASCASVSTQHRHAYHKWRDSDIDNSASFSESDVDNTTYQDSINSSSSQQRDNPSMLNSINDKRLGRKQNKIDNSTFNEARLLCQNNFRSGMGDRVHDDCRNNTTLMVNERLDIQMAPCHRSFIASGLLIGPVTRKQDQSLGAFSKQTYGKAVSATVCSRRHVAARIGPHIQHVPGRMNDMQKDSGIAHPCKLWSNEYDFPRNITATECLESPTENWQCDQQFIVCCKQEDDENQSSQTREEQSSKSVTCQKDKTSRLAPSNCSRSYETSIQEPSNGPCSNDPCSNGPCSKETLIVKKRSENMEPLEFCLPQMCHGYDDVFEMIDASVQTEFADDFSRWDDSETQQNPEERAADVSESTRMWLLTGNMQGSADTGYSSLTRDSLIFMDDDSVITAGDLEAMSAAKRLSTSETSSKNNFCLKEFPSINGLTFDNGLKSNRLDMYSSSQTEVKNRISTGEQNIQISTTFSQSDSPISKQQTKIHSTSEMDTTLSKSASDCSRRPSLMSDTDSRLCRLIQDGSKGKNSMSTRSSSDSSDRTLKYSDSDDVDSDVISVTATKITNSPDSGTRGAKTFEGISQTFVASNKKSQPEKTDAPVSNFAPREGQANMGSTIGAPREGQANMGSTIGAPREGQVNTGSTIGLPKILSNDLKSLSKLALSERVLCCRLDWENCKNISSGFQPGLERADYLEFLKDAPLNRLHLKRPLFLVPGLGPVDMSCSEQINLFSETDRPRQKTPSSSTTTMCTPTMALTSADVCGKKLKYKRSDHITLPPSNTTLPKQAGVEQQCVRFVPSSLNHTQIPNCAGHEPPPIHTFYHDPTKQPVDPSSTSCGNHTHVRTAPYHLVQSSLPTNMTLSQTNQKPLSSSSHTCSSPAEAATIPASTTAVRTRELQERKQKDGMSRNVRERVMSLRREKDLVFQKIKEVRQDDQLHRLQLQGQLNSHRKEVLLETLHELKQKLEEESKLLMMSEGASRNT